MFRGTALYSRIRLFGINCGKQMSTSAAPVKVRVWCFVGKRNLEQASASSGVPISVQWEPFFLDSTIPPEGRDLMEHLRAKYGHQAIERFSKPDNPLDVAGQRVGIAFNKARRIINTLDGHRVVEWCNLNHPDKSDFLMEKLFHAYFEEAKDLSNRDTLLDVSSSAGLPKESLSTMLETDEFVSQVLEKDGLVKRQRINGVPFFIIENQNGGRPLAFSGAQPADVIAEALVEAQKE